MDEGGGLVEMLWENMELLAFIAFAVVASLFKSRANKGRKAAMEAYAAKGGFEFWEFGNPVIMDKLPTLEMFSKDSIGSVEQLMREVVDGDDVYLFDYSLRVSHGRGSYTSYDTYSAVVSHDLHLPAFSLRPETIADKAFSFFKGQDINFEDSPDFSKRYLLAGENEQQVRKLFTAKVLKYFEQTGNLLIEGKGRTVVVTLQAVDVSLDMDGHDRRVSMDKFEVLKQLALQIARLLKDSQQSANA